MGRGDTMANRKCKNKGGTNRVYMPPSRNTVFAPSNITEDELQVRWESAFGKNKEPKRYECTCNEHEEEKNNTIWLVKDRCRLHGRASKKELKLTDIQKKFSKRHMKKVKDHIMYGNTDVREILDRN